MPVGVGKLDKSNDIFFLKFLLYFVIVLVNNFLTIDTNVFIQFSFSRNKLFNIIQFIYKYIQRYSSVWHFFGYLFPWLDHQGMKACVPAKIETWKKRFIFGKGWQRILHHIIYPHTSHARSIIYNWLISSNCYLGTKITWYI